MFSSFFLLFLYYSLSLSLSILYFIDASATLVEHPVNRLELLSARGKEEEWNGEKKNKQKENMLIRILLKYSHKK